MNEELKKLNKLTAENPDMKVVFVVDFESTEDTYPRIETRIESVEIVDRVKYNLCIYDYPYYYDIDELIDDDIMKVEAIDKVEAKKEAISLMKKTIVVRLATWILL